MRDRRWDFLYEQRRQPVKEFVLERFAEVLAAELRGWPPANLEWTSEAERARWAAGVAGPAREEVVRLALAVARLDLQREFEQVEAHLAREGHRLNGAAEEAAVHLLVRTITEACFELSERAERLRLGRTDLVQAVDAVERLLFRVTSG